MVAHVGDFKRVGLDGSRLLAEQTAVGHAGTIVAATVAGGQDISVAVQYLEKVGASRAVLVLIGIIAGCVLGDGDVYIGVGGIESHRAGIFIITVTGEVLPRNGGETDYAPADVLADGGIACTGDSERAA